MSRKQFKNVICKYGAPMGRTESLTDLFLNNPSGKVRCFKVRFVDGDYDDGGAYWGRGVNNIALYCATKQKGTVTNGDGLLMFTRAFNRMDAKAQFQGKASAICGNKKGNTISWIN